ncbi:MAG: GMC family oxidoreductase [Acidobacteriota bacterium]
MQQQSYDLIVVGSGTAGLILAARIAEHGVHPRTGEPLRIASIEAGPYWKGDLRPGYGIPSRRQMITNLSGRRYQWPTGFAKIVGGSSTHWGNASLFPFDSDYLRWYNETGVDWSKDKLQDAVAEVTRMYNFHQAPEVTLGEGNRLFRTAARQMGYQTTRFPMTRTNCLYCGYCGSGYLCRTDSKSSSLVYIPIAEKHGVEIIPDTEVEQVLFDKTGERGRVTGVSYRQGDQTGILRAPKVLLACGVINTPVLLMRSGYGSRELLGDKLKVENPNVGNHYNSDQAFAVTAISDKPLMEAGRGTNNGNYFFDYGEPDGDFNLMISSNYANRLIVPQSAAISGYAPEFGRQHKEYMKTACTRISGVLMHQTGSKNSRGRVLPDGSREYSSDPRMIQRFEEGGELCRKVLAGMGLKKIRSGNIAERVRAYRGNVHAMGSCRAGVDPRESVVNPRFESHDIEGLLICDGSVIPRCGSSEACIPIVTVAAFAWRRVVEDHFS